MSEEIRTLSDDEKRWLNLLAEGKKTSEVAKEIDMPKGTFAYKLNLVRERFGCRNMASLMVYLTRNGLID